MHYRKPIPRFSRQGAMADSPTGAWVQYADYLEVARSRTEPLTDAEFEQWREHKHHGLTPRDAFNVVLAGRAPVPLRVPDAQTLPVPEEEARCAFTYPGGTRCGYRETDCMHHGSRDAAIPLMGKHDFIPDRPTLERPRSLREHVAQIYLRAANRLTDEIMEHLEATTPDPAPEPTCGVKIYEGTSGQHSCGLTLGHPGKQHRSGNFTWYDAGVTESHS
jgi:hypothetical protein